MVVAATKIFYCAKIFYSWHLAEHFTVLVKTENMSSMSFTLKGVVGFFC